MKIIFIPVYPYAKQDTLALLNAASTKGLTDY